MVPLVFDGRLGGTTSATAADPRTPMDEITVFADVACPFAYVGLSRIAAYRGRMGAGLTPIHVRAWPLEVVNGEPLSGASLVPKIEALRRGVAPELFQGFSPEAFPTTSQPALAAEHAAYRAGLDKGLGFSLAIRRLLFEEGADIGDPVVVAALIERASLPEVTGPDRAAVADDHEEGLRRGVQGSPHFFTPRGSFFCPTLDIEHRGQGYEVSFDAEGFDAFVSSAFG
jgi:2-hydroxychromene-2-carboxylate isomerase